MNQYQVFEWGFMWSQLPSFGTAILVTLKMFVLGAGLAMTWGLILVLGRLRRKGVIYKVTTAYVEFYRNTPILIQLYFMFFALPSVGIRMTPFVTGVLALTAQHAAFFCEVYRGAIQNIGSLQRKAGSALGMTNSNVMRYVVLPQAVRDALPPVTSQLVLLLQDTAIMSAVGVVEITLHAYEIAERTAASFEMFVLLALVYFAIGGTISGVLRITEARLRVRR